MVLGEIVLGEMNSYEIRVAGQLDSRWSEWFEGFTLTNDADGGTTLRGLAVDQAALHGALRRVGDLGVTLISVNVRDDATPPRPQPLTLRRGRSSWHRVVKQVANGFGESPRNRTQRSNASSTRAADARPAAIA